MRNLRLKRLYAGCYRYNTNTDEYRIVNVGYDPGTRQRNVWRVFTVPVTTTKPGYWASSLREAIERLEGSNNG